MPPYRRYAAPSNTRTAATVRLGQHGGDLVGELDLAAVISR